MTCTVKRSAFAAVAIYACVAGACGRPIPSDGPGALTFLTRAGCANTDSLRANLDDAIKTLGRPISYAMIDLDTLPRTDVRTAYPTPTVLYRDRDVFGIAVPQPPYPEPT